LSSVVTKTNVTSLAAKKEATTVAVVYNTTAIWYAETGGYSACHTYFK
jgi:hypothetical protein